jgi:hypothetical protein
LGGTITTTTELGGTITHTIELGGTVAAELGDSIVTESGSPANFPSSPRKRGSICLIHTKDTGFPLSRE